MKLTLDEIVKDHGYLGLALYTHFGQYLNNLNTDNLIPSLLRHYCNTNPSKSKNCNEMDFDSLLSLEGLKEVLNKKLFSDRDLLPMKVLLSIYENHLKDPSDIKHTRRYLDDLMPVVSLFYSSLTDEQIEKLKIKLDKSKGILKNLIRSRKILNLSSRLKYMAHYNKVKTQIKTLIDGLQNEKFYM